MWLVLALMLPLALSLGSEVESGCADWSLDPSKQACCQTCKPGNQLVRQCGLDPQTLCAPCINGTYATEGIPKSCLRCTQCLSPMRVKTPCTASSDTVCDCDYGFRCGDQKCSFCIQVCGKGEEPSNRRCQPCPAGKFNNQTHQHCISWSSSCPFPNQRIIAAGTAVSDIVCADVEPTLLPPDVKPTAIQQDSEYISPGLTLAIAVICACLILCSTLPFCVLLHYKSRKTLKTAPIHVKAPAGRRQVPEPEQCSFCFPQEERGSNSESSLISDDKPFELVV
ncbi:tumor necrosis factor receptor superfamily member 9b [Trichomycterus rosablanca]|uniref:tumor necrosis factor receptor superfamily member 9b n=1 Tax=Trichomycterus rosablanca TaxID=2290929 RepID=UPI002F351B5D